MKVAPLDCGAARDPGSNPLLRPGPGHGVHYVLPEPPDAAGEPQWLTTAADPHEGHAAVVRRVGVPVPGGPRRLLDHVEPLADRTATLRPSRARTRGAGDRRGAEGATRAEASGRADVGDDAARPAGARQARPERRRRGSGRRPPPESRPRGRRPAPARSPVRDGFRQVVRIQALERPEQAAGARSGPSALRTNRPRRAATAAARPRREARVRRTASPPRTGR